MANAKPGRAVGLEIDSGVARAVEAGGSPAATRLFALASSPLPEGSVEEGMVLKPADVGSALRGLWSAGAIRERQVLLGVSNQGVLVRYATIPRVPAAKLDNVIRFHAQEHLPIPLDSVVMDYMVIGEVEKEEGKMLEVLLVAARRDMLGGFLEALDLAGLQAADIDVSTLALMRTLPAAASDRTVAVVNIANGLSNILVSARGRPRLARLVSAKIKDLADKLNCPLDAVINLSVSDQPAVREVLQPWINNLVSEVHSSLAYFQNQPDSTELEAVVLNGRGARLGGIARRLEEELELPVRIVSPFAGYVNSGKKEQVHGPGAVEYAISAGLARRGLEGS